MAAIAPVLFKNFMQFDASDPHWINCDRFILSNRHGSMLLYSQVGLLELAKQPGGVAQACRVGYSRDSFYTGSATPTSTAAACQGLQSPTPRFRETQSRARPHANRGRQGVCEKAPREFAPTGPPLPASFTLTNI
jgi:Transketolase, thiamine diphosphate binding domain